MNEDNLMENVPKRTPFAPLQCRIVEPNTKPSNKLLKACYLSPLDSESVRRRRAKEFGLTPPPTDSFLKNQSFPGLRKDPENGNPCTDMGNVHRYSIDKFKGDELNTISFSPFKNLQQESEIYQNRHLDGSWMLYKYIETNSGNQSLHSYAHNPNKAILTINARTTEILTANKTAFDLLGIKERVGFHKLSDFILSPEDQYLFTEADLKPNGEIVLFSGKVMDLLTRAKESIPVSMWARQLSTESDIRCLVIMEPAERITGTVKFDSQGTIVNCDVSFAHLYGYEKTGDVVGFNIKDFIPSLDLELENNLPEGGMKLCATGKTKDNFNFPLNVNIRPCSFQDEEEDVKSDKSLESVLPVYEGIVWVFSNISGLITILPGGAIHSCNTNFSMMLFGYPQTELVGKDISTLIPSFYDDVEFLDTNSVALPPFDDDEDSNAKCGNSDGRTTADSFIADPPRPMNPLGRPINDEEISNHEHAFTPFSRESLSSIDHSSSFEDYANENLSSNIFPSKESDPRTCDMLKNEEQSASSIDNSSRHMSCSESQDTLHSSTAESDINANVFDLASGGDQPESAAVRKCSCDEKCESDNFESESENPGSEHSESGEESYDSEESVCSEDDLADEDASSKDKDANSHFLCDCKQENYSPEMHSSNCFRNEPAFNLRVSTPKQCSQNISKSSHDISYQSIPEGVYIGIGRHKDGTDLAIEYCIKKVFLDSGKYLYCIWVSRDPEEIKEGSPTNRTSSSSHYDTSKTTQTGSEESGSGSSHSSMLPDEEYLAGPFSEHYTVVQHMGKGAFGCIKKAYRNADGLLVIAKFIKKSEVYKDSWVFDSKLNNTVPLELSLLTTISHPNIVKVLDVFENKQCFHMVMEKHGSGMDLFEFIERNPKMDEALSSYIFRQMVSALSYLHTLNILHRDIKDENAIINEKFHVKLIDFGSAAFMGEGELFSTFCGTTEYCSPEVLRGEKYRGPELEMFALGVTLFTLVLGQNPFVGADEILKGEYSIDKEISKGLSDLIKHMLEPNPTKRCTLAECQSHPWVNQPILIENYKFSEVVTASEDELHPVKYISFSGSENDVENSNNSSDSEVSYLEQQMANVELNKHSSSESDS